jgi:hypothetical protein
MYTRPRYSPRADWWQKLQQGGPGTNTWQSQMVVYWIDFRKSGGKNGLTLEDAWKKLRLSQVHANGALVSDTPRPTNDAGVIPPEVFSHVFARAAAKDPIDDFADFGKGQPVKVTMDPDFQVLTYIRPRYAPRVDWKEKLQSLQATPGSWQYDLAAYWRLRTTKGLSEAKAWEDVRMSPANARQALIQKPPTPTNDSGLIPSDPNAPYKETVARRLFARAMAKDINPKDMFAGLVLDPPVHPEWKKHFEASQRIRSQPARR